MLLIPSLLTSAHDVLVSIENNSAYPLTVNAMTVCGKPVINSAAAAGYGYIFAADGDIVLGGGIITNE